MTSIAQNRLHVKSMKIVFNRRVTRAYRRYEDGRVEVTITRDGRVTFYVIDAISSDIGGLAFRWNKRSEGDERATYDVLVNSSHDSCTCPGFCWTERQCKHLRATADLLRLGVLNAAPASAAGCTCGECSDADMNWDLD